MADDTGRARPSGRARAAQRRREERRKGQLTLLAILGGVALLVVVVVALWSASGDSDRGELTEKGEPVVVAGTPLPGFSSAQADPAVGLTAPTITGTNLRSGQPDITIEPDGMPKVVVFLAHWCPHCQAEVPRLQDWLTQNGGLPADVEIVSVATGLDPARGNYPPSEWLFGEEGWQYPVLIDDELSTAANAYGLGGYPYYVVLDAAGNVLARQSGEIDVSGWVQLIDLARTGAGAVPEGGESSGVDGSDTATTAAAAETTAAP